MTLVIDPEFKALIPALSPDELAQLEASLLSEGCRDALVVWAGQNILVDGHNRYELCTKHGLPYRTVEREFDSRADVEVWMLKNQLGRRNLPEPTRVKLALRLKPALAQQADERMKAGKAPDPNSHVNKGATKTELAKEANVGATTLFYAETVLEKAPDYVRDAYEAQETAARPAYELTKALEKVSEQVRADCIKYKVVDPQLVALLEEKKSTETYTEVMASGRIQFNGDDDPRDKDLHEATAWDFQGLIRAKHKEHRATGAAKRQSVKMNAVQNTPADIYSIIYADPPWQYDNSGLYGSAEHHYPTMPLEDICNLPTAIPLQFADNAVLFLWATNPLLSEALQVVTAWGFQYKTNFAWDKGKPTSGLGFYIKGQHELLLIATKGGYWEPINKPPSVLKQPKGPHSAKPILHPLIESMYPDQRYIELFAREYEERKNWTYWGGELEQTAA